jgi:hypothetical protein
MHSSSSGGGTSSGSGGGSGADPKAALLSLKDNLALNVAMMACSASNSDGSACSVPTLEASNGTVKPLIAKGAKVTPGSSGAFTIVTSGGGETYTYQQNPDSSSDRSCKPADPTVCPGGNWPGTP